MTAPPRDKNDDVRRSGMGPRAIAEISARLTRRAFGRHGFAEASLIADWPLITGSLIGSWTMPVRIVFPRGERSGGVLHIKAASGSVALVIQHQERLIKERVNSYFGYGAVARIALIQGPIPKRAVASRPAPPPLSEDRAKHLGGLLAPVPDADLQAALDRLGRRLAADW
ncbi:MAG: DciA family protein [Rhodospirillaceae bacterium]|nr:DciA family protein [Rhodospirillaceae bacterium]